MKLLSATLFLLIIKFSYCFAQDITGTWEGNVGGQYMKMVILKRGNTCIGYTYDKDFGYCIANFMGEFNDSTHRLKGAGQGFIEKTFGHMLMSFRLTYSASGEHKLLSGTARPKSVTANLLTLGLPMPARLTQTSSGIDTTDFMYSWLRTNSPLIVENSKKKDSIRVISQQAVDTLSRVAITAANDTIAGTTLPAFDKKAFDDSIRAVKTQRQADILSRIVTRADSIVITISDNEVVDGDTITIFHNNEILVSRLFVSSKPYRVVIPLTNNMPIHEFVLVANNLGTIPPNTALVVIEAGRERYQLKAAADMKKNAVIVFERRN